MISQECDTIWRYMTLAELANILERRSLVFRQLRSLGRDDRAEGAIPDDLYTRDVALSEDLDAKAKGLRANVDLGYCTYVHCWHRAEHEHSAFWRIYGHRGVAVRACISTLREQTFWRNCSLRGEDIVYADTWAEAEEKGLSVPQGITPNRSAMQRKRRAFSWEDEWRIFYSPPTAKYGVIEGRLPPNEYEIARSAWHAKWPEYEEVGIDAVQWISRVVIAPASPRWVLESIESITKRHSLECVASAI